MSNPTQQKLPDTLARRVRFLREERGITPRKLGELCHLTEQQVDDIEAGLEVFLAPAIRNRLARALRVKPIKLWEVERHPPEHVMLGQDPEWQQNFLASVLENPERTYFCPNCGEKLAIRSFDRWDLEDNPIISFKIRCTQCLFKAGYRLHAV